MRSADRDNCVDLQGMIPLVQLRLWHPIRTRFVNVCIEDVAFQDVYTFYAARGFYGTYS